MHYAIKAKILAPDAQEIELLAQKTMYGGKNVVAGDDVFLFSSETSGGRGLVARGLVTSARSLPRIPGVARQTPCVDVTIRISALARRQLGRSELKFFTDWSDGMPETELNFKFYRQATDKLVGISHATAAFLDGYF